MAKALATQRSRSTLTPQQRMDAYKRAISQYMWDQLPLHGNNFDQLPPKLRKLFEVTYTTYDAATDSDVVIPERIDGGSVLRVPKEPNPNDIPKILRSFGLTLPDSPPAPPAGQKRAPTRRPRPKTPPIREEPSETDLQQIESEAQGITPQAPRDIRKKEPLA